MDKTKIDLNAPAFGPGAQTLEDVKADTGTEEAPTEDSQPEEEIKAEEEKSEPSEEEQKVPYSRFKKYHDKAEEAEREALYWQAKAEALQELRSETQENQTTLPDYWVELYGDSDASEKAWKTQQRALEEIKKEAREEALQAVKEERTQESQKLNENLETIDQNFEKLSSLIGRDISEKEQSAVLDIVDDYTPKDENGNYLGATIPFEKAWEIYELKKQAIDAPKQKSRDSVASLTGTQTQGDTTIEEKNKSFNPLNWNAWKDRL